MPSSSPPTGAILRHYVNIETSFPRFSEHSLIASSGGDSRATVPACLSNARPPTRLPAGHSAPTTQPHGAGAWTHPYRHDQSFRSMIPVLPVQPCLFNSRKVTVWRSTSLVKVPLLAVTSTKDQYCFRLAALHSDIENNHWAFQPLPNNTPVTTLPAEPSAMEWQGSKSTEMTPLPCTR